MNLTEIITQIEFEARRHEVEADIAENVKIRNDHLAAAEMLEAGAKVIRAVERLTGGANGIHHS